MNNLYLVLKYKFMWWDITSNIKQVHYGTMLLKRFTMKIERCQFLYIWLVKQSVWKTSWIAKKGREKEERIMEYRNEELKYDMTR